MFGKKNNDKSVNYKDLNEVILLSKKILKIAFFLIIVVGIYAITMLLKEWKVFSFILSILKILTPLFIGIVVAWLFNPLVSFLKKKGIKRGLGAAIVYLLLIGIILLVLGSLIPVLSEQINDFAKTIPSILNSVMGAIDGILEKLGDIANFDVENMKTEIYGKIQSIGVNLTNSLPSMTVSFVKSFFSGLGTFGVGLIIGFYLLVSFDSANDTIFSFLPKKFQNTIRDLFNEVNTSLRKYVQGTLMLASLVFVVSTIGFLISGLKAPLLFGLFCGITDIIPYLGPYIGGIPAVVVGFSQSPLTGIITLVAIVIVQFIEGNLLQPLIMSKQLKIHPVTIMLGLLVFGYFFGIVGMVLATPAIATIKVIFNFFDEKYNITHVFEE